MFSPQIKTIGSISKIYGLIATGFGTILILTSFILRVFFNAHHFPPHPKMNFKLYFVALHEVWMIYMPLMVLIGLLYLLSGQGLSHNRKFGKVLLLTSSLLNIGWFLFYINASRITVLPLVKNAFPSGIITFSFILTAFVTCGYPTFVLAYFWLAKAKG